jgi:putative flippase GtrA
VSQFSFRQLFQYGLVGLLATATYFGALYLCESVLKLHYQITVTVAYFASVVTHFSANRRFTFEQTGSADVRALRRYATTVIINYGISLIIVSACVELFGWPTWAGVALSMAATVLTGYALMRLWVFAPSKTQAGADRKA